MPRQNLGRVKGDKGDPFTFDDFTSGQLDGITPKMVLGNVTTLGPDENAAVNMRNEGLKNYVDFAIPRGKNGAEAKNIPAENVEMADKTTLESAMATVNESVNTNNTEINKIKTPTFTDTVGTYTTLNAANTAAETASNAIKSKVNILTTLSNMKKSFSAIVQGLKILATNVGMIQGITSDLNSESDYIAASSKALATLNGNLGNLSGWIPYSNSFNLEFVDGVGTVTIPGKTVLATSLAVWSIWSPGFNGMASAANGKIQVNGYQVATPVTGVQWVALAGLIKVQ